MRVSSVRPLVPGSAVLLAALAGVAGASAPGCSQTPLPGTMYGTYKVTAETKTNSCGAGIDAPDPWVFDAQVSQDGTTVYWSFMDGNAPLSGILTASSANISATTTANVDATDAGLGPCTMSRADTLDLTFATGSPPPSFAGTITYQFTVPSGSTCTDQLASAGGQYNALPCTLSYSLSAAIQ
ncbi:MAG: hypothetical protein ACLQBL_25670 [Polyangiaceae bacterium]|jgi:hypothetical protein